MNEMWLDLLIIRPYIHSMPAHIAADNLRGRCHGLICCVASIPLSCGMPISRIATSG